MSSLRYGIAAIAFGMSSEYSTLVKEAARSATNGFAILSLTLCAPPRDAR
jgi:hypothetical protein